MTPSAEDRLEEWRVRSIIGLSEKALEAVIATCWKAYQDGIADGRASREPEIERLAFECCADVKQHMKDVRDKEIEAARREQMESDCAVAQECHGNPSVGHQDHGFKVCHVVDAIRAAFEARSE